MNVSSASSAPKLPPVVAATTVATNRAADFAQLGVRDVTVADGGVRLTFAAPEAARVGRAILRDSIDVATAAGSNTVPITVDGVPTVPTISADDARRAIQQLGHIAAVTTSDVSGKMTVFTTWDAAADRVTQLSELLRPTIAGRPVEVLRAAKLGGWGAGVG